MRKLKLLFIVALLAMGSSAFAQTYVAYLEVQNGSPCTATVTMYAVAPTSGPDVCGQIIGNSFSVAPSNHINWLDWVHFQSSNGWSYIYNPVPAASTDFEWTDAVITFNCPTWECTPPPMTLSSSCLYLNGCEGGTNPASTSCLSNTVSATWSATPCSGALDDVSISIY